MFGYLNDSVIMWPIEKEKAFSLWFNSHIFRAHRARLSGHFNNHPMSMEGRSCVHTY
jgi:hypothetical protein